jgi:hypothetical protein
MLHFMLHGDAASFWKSLEINVVCCGMLHAESGVMGKQKLG